MKNKNLDLEIMKVSKDFKNSLETENLTVFQVIKSSQGLDSILGEYLNEELALSHLRAIETSFKHTFREEKKLIIDDIEIKIREIGFLIES
jgi:hypothetical protein